MKKELICFFVLILFSFPMVDAATYYVSITGSNNNPGTETQPFRTIQFCSDIAQPGDTCLIYPGVYEERVNINRGGTSSERVIFKAHPSKSVVITNGFNVGQIWNVRAEYVTIEGFNITNQLVIPGQPYTFERHGITIHNGSYLEIIDNYFYDVVGSAILLANNGITGVYIGYNTIYKCAMGIDFSLRLGFNTIIEHNEIERLYSWAEIDGVPHVDNDYIRIGGENFTVKNNYLHGTKYPEITYRARDSNGNFINCNRDSDCTSPFFCAWDNYCRYNSHVDNIEVTHYLWPSGGYVKNGTIENNILLDSHQGIKNSASSIDSGKLFSDVTIRNNIIAYQWGNGIYIGGVENVRVYNNHFYNLLWHGIMFTSSGSTLTNGSAIVYNNLFYNTRIFFHPAYGLDIFTERNNLLYNFASICTGEHCGDFELDQKTSELLNMQPYLANMPHLLVDYLGLREIRSPTQFVIHSSFNPNISVGDYLVYKNDGIIRKIIDKQLDGDNLILMVDSSLENYEIINFMITKQPVRYRPFLEIWKNDSNPTIDFSLTNLSPAIDSGFNLAGIFNYDIIGTPRPQGYAWDIGAYEYVSGEIIPDPPTPPITPTSEIVTLQDMLGAYQQYKRNEVSLIYFLDKLRRWIVFW